MSTRAVSPASHDYCTRISSHSNSEFPQELSSLIQRDGGPAEQLGVKQLQSANVNLAQVGTFKACQFQVGIAQTAAQKDRIAKIATKQVRFREVELSKLHLAE